MTHHGASSTAQNDVIATGVKQKVRYYLS